MNRVSASSSLYSIPEEITPQDHQVLCHGGTSSNLERLPSRLQQHKSPSPRNTRSHLEDLAYETSYLKAELAWKAESMRSFFRFQEEMYIIFHKIEDALGDLNIRLQEAEQRYLGLWGVSVGEGNDGGMI
ncbi:uncharacterized protein BDV17DRAFT_299038 [Aspergillus undulatus]|uniref:uncharacterized protein n=1 Tax=Aspergillus undulatus TaxID=1810928 RepID=UPI003CCCC183